MHVLLRESKREDYLTKALNARYNPRADLSEWVGFVREVTGGDEELAGFLKRAVGYTLSGDIREEVLFFVYGPTGTGKSTFLRAVGSTFGDYATTIDFTSFLKGWAPDKPRNDIAALAGVHMVMSIEVAEGSKLAEGLIKQLTGGDPVSARFLFKESFSYIPQFKLWLVANHAPKVAAGDDAMWRRILRVSFEHKAERIDKTLKDRFSHSADVHEAVLLWAVQGMEEWGRIGLAPPLAVLGSTAAYREENDPVREFILDCLEVEEMEGREGDRKRWRLRAGEAYKRYHLYCKECGMAEKEILLGTKFSAALMRHFGKTRDLRGMAYLGVRLKEEEEMGRGRGGDEEGDGDVDELM